MGVVFHRQVTAGNVTQSITEICEHCGEKVVDLHISDLAHLHPNENRTTEIKKADGTRLTLKIKKDRIRESTASLMSRELLSADELSASDLEAGKDLRYGLRAESLCSESIDNVRGITASYCFRVTHPKFLAKYSSSYHTGSEVETNSTGSKIGVDRKGNIIRLKSDLNIGIIDTADGVVKYQGPHKTSWWRSVPEVDQNRYISQSHACSRLKSDFGEPAVKDMTVVDQFRDQRDWDGYMTRNCR